MGELTNESHKQKLQNFEQIMSKFGLPFLPSALIWTKISLDKYAKFCILCYGMALKGQTMFILKRTKF